MLMQTNISFCGCRVWLDHENKQTLKNVSRRFETWVRAMMTVSPFALITGPPRTPAPLPRPLPPVEGE